MPSTKRLSPTPSPQRQRTPELAGAGPFIMLVLALSGLQAAATVLENLGASPPQWLDAVAMLLGGGFSPLWAMLAVGGLTLGWPGLRRVLNESLRLRVDRRLYLVSLLAPLALVVFAAMLSGTTPAFGNVEPVHLVSPFLLLAPLFALAENLGWRAWLQRVLQTRMSPLLAGVLVGVVWGVWHLPMGFSGPLYAQLPVASFLVMVITRSVLLAALFNAAHGSVVPVVVAHLAFNLGTLLSLPTQPSQATPLFLAIAAVSAVAAAVLVRWSRAKDSARHRAML